MAQLNRREFIYSSSAALASLMFLWPSIGQAAEVDKITWEKLLKLLDGMAATQHQKNWNQDTYCQGVAKVLKQLKTDDAAILKFQKAYKSH